MDVFRFERRYLWCSIGQREYQSGGQSAVRRLGHLHSGCDDKCECDRHLVEYGDGDTTGRRARFRTGQQLGDGYGHADGTGADSNTDSNTNTNTYSDANAANTDPDADTYAATSSDERRGRH